MRQLLDVESPGVLRYLLGVLVVLLGVVLPIGHAFFLTRKAPAGARRQP